MTKCPKCGQEISGTAKFCRHCGHAIAESAEKTCPQCLKKIPATAKFCRYCGNRFEGENVAVTAADEEITANKNYITWRISPGQMAVKIDKRDIEGYGKVKGLYIAPGTRALFFVDGKFVAELESGQYPFWNIDKDTDKESNFWNKISSYVKYNFGKLLGRNNEMVVLMRGNEFPLLYTIKDVPTANIRIEVGVRLLCELTNLDMFFSSCLTDIKFIGLESFAERFAPSVRVTLGRVMSGMSLQEIQNNVELFEKTLEALRAAFAEVAPFVRIKQIIDLAATHDALEKIREMKEEMYVADQELEHWQLREDFLNKFQNAKYNNLLRTARFEVDFRALMDKIDEDGILNEDKKEQFVLMLSAERLLREARTETETEQALDGLKRSKMLSEEEVETLRRNIEHRANMAELNDAQAIAMATMQNAEALDREALKWELEIGNNRFRNELDRQRQQDEYTDTRRNADFEFQNRRMASKMELLKQAQALREEREDNRHRREMEMKKIDSETELERQRITASMSYEQIMASNPDITPEAAAALAKKYEAEAIAAQNDKTAELVKRHDEDLKEILTQQMSLTREIVASQNQANSNAIAEKQRELDRVHEDSERHQDRMLSGMETTVSAVSQARPNSEIVFCPNCGKKNNGKAEVCESCGSSLE